MTRRPSRRRVRPLTGTLPAAQFQPTRILRGGANRRVVAAPVRRRPHRLPLLGAVPALKLSRLDLRYRQLLRGASNGRCDPSEGRRTAAAGRNDLQNTRVWHRHRVSAQTTVPVRPEEPHVDEARRADVFRLRPRQLRQRCSGLTGLWVRPTDQSHAQRIAAARAVPRIPAVSFVPFFRSLRGAAPARGGAPGVSGT